jgi:hypothetical protein
MNHTANDSAATAELLHSILGARTICFHRAFVGPFGVKGALMLSQAFYWSKRCGEDGWFYKTNDEWQEEIGLTPDEQRSARSSLADVLIVQARGLPRRNFFKIDMQKLIAVMTYQAGKTSASCPETPPPAVGNTDLQSSGNPTTGGRETRRLITEITSETTTEITTEKYKPHTDVQQQTSSGKPDVCVSPIVNSTATATASANSEEAEEQYEFPAHVIPEDQKKPSKKDIATSSDVRTIFEHWKKTTGHPRAVLDGKREGYVRRALKRYPLESLLTAIDGWKASPYHQGINETGTVYDALTLILRDAEHIERFIGYASNPPKSKAEQQAEDDDNWVYESALKSGRPII